MSLVFFKSCVLVLLSAVTFAVLSSAASAQDSVVSQRCAQLGFKLGTKGHTDCVNQNSGAGSGKAAPKPELTALQREDAFWADTKAVGNKAAFEAYLERYPSGRYAGLAKANIERITSAKVPPSASAAPPSNVRSAGKIFKECADCPEMVVIPAGSFEMGGTASDELPLHRVTLKSFSMGKTEVTQGQWRAVMGGNPSRFSDCGDSCPVEQVSWDDAKRFVSRLSAKTGKTYRLPSEAEWEYACRAGGRGEYCGSDSADYVAWYDRNSGGGTHSVAGKQANAWGLHDMSGNVREWTDDCWNENYSGAPTDGNAWTTGNCSLRVVRGGSWFNDPQNLRSALRYGSTPAFRNLSYGFRVARTD